MEKARLDKVLANTDDHVPDELDVHLICDNYSTHKHPTVNKWFAAHPRFHMHFSPTYSSWINQVERFFAYVTADLMDLKAVANLADQILGSLARLLQRTTGAGP